MSLDNQCLRVVSWNCNGAFRKKYEPVLLQQPDVCVIQECESLNNIPFTYSDALWFGEKKGIGIFAFNGHTLEVHPDYNDAYKWVVPITVRGKNNFLLFAVWTKVYKGNTRLSYITQLYLALQAYKHLLHQSCMIIGDWNSNVIWDKLRPKTNHSKVVSFLEQYAILSLYHEATEEEQGKETIPTFYMYRKPENPYHIDYCFTSKGFIENGFRIILGDKDGWLQYSDHVPLVVETGTGIK